MKKSLLFFILVFSIILTSCNKDDKEYNTKVAENYALGESMFSDVFKQVTDGSLWAEDTITNKGAKSSYTSLTSSCATLSITPFDLTTFPKTLIVDYGTTNCLCSDGRYRRGVINAVLTGWYRDSSTVITINPSNYFVNDYLVEGTKTVTNKGHNTSGNLEYDIVVTNGSITGQEGTSTWNTNRTNEWIECESTIFNPWDDVYLIRGSANGVTVESEAYTMNILQDLRVELSCKWIVSGLLRIEGSNSYTIDVDYGNGNCDALAVVTINNYSINISLQ
jgi:hypothetical protein